MVYLGFPSFAKGKAEFWPSPCSKVCTLQYIFEYTCSYLSSNIAFLLDRMCRSSLDVLTCCELPPELCISRTLGSQEQGTSVQNPLHVYTVILLCEKKYLFHVALLFNLVNA